MMGFIGVISYIYADIVAPQGGSPNDRVYAAQIKNNPLILNPQDQVFIDTLKNQSLRVNAEDKAFIETIKDKALDQEAVAFGEKINKEKTLQVIHDVFPESKKRCLIRKDGEREERFEPTRNGVHLTIFMSFCIPPQVWQDLFKASEQYPFTFVVRGLPQNDFELLAQKVKEIGCPVHVHPELFEQYSVDKVPAFVFVEGDHHEGVIGNVSLTCVLDHFKEQGKGIGRRYAA